MKINEYLKKNAILIILVAAVIAAVFFLGRSCSNGPTVDPDTELYSNAIAEIGKLRTEIAEYNRLIGELQPELEGLTTAIRDSQVGVETSIGISQDLESDSGEIGDLARELSGDLASIRTASIGLAEIFNVKTEGN